MIERVRRHVCIKASKTYLKSIIFEYDGQLVGVISVCLKGPTTFRP